MLEEPTEPLSGLATVNEADTAPSYSTDYVQYACFAFFMLIGIPVNFSTFVYIWNRFRHARSFLLLLHINLNISDILVLAFYCPIALLAALSHNNWRGGDVLCKAMHFFNVFIFSAGSNIMVCIAVYRLVALRNPLWVSAVGHSRVPKMLGAAWGMAAVLAAPQLYVFRVMDHPVDPDSKMCVSVFVEDIYTRNISASNQPLMTVILFYIPLLFLLVCYILILRDIYSTLSLEAEETSVVYVADSTPLSSCGLRRSKGSAEATVILRRQSSRGQDRFQRAKVRSLRITLLLILTYLFTWLPYNSMVWLMIIDMEQFINWEEWIYFLNYLVIANSVINPFIYGRCQSFKLFLTCGREAGPKRHRRVKKNMHCVCV